MNKICDVSITSIIGTHSFTLFSFYV